MTSDQVLLGIGLIAGLAVGCQLIAARLRFPAIVLLLPAGFVAGVLTQNVNPQLILGQAFEPLVSLAVAVILYDAGLGLDLGRLSGQSRRVLVQLIWLGTLLTWLLSFGFAKLLFGLSSGAAVMLGAILVVSGPTVVGPLLAHVRPVDRLQHLLGWEGSLIDPIGAIIGALTLHAVGANAHRLRASGLLQFGYSAGVGLLGGALGAAVLWLLLGRLRLPEVLGTAVQMAVVIGVAAVCDVLRDDSGLVAAIVMGVAMANLPEVDVPARSLFFETLVKLLLGVLFISISATVSAESLEPLIWPALGFVAVLVLLVRPLVTGLATLWTDLSGAERVFVGWMAPRGIVAASTASAFSVALTRAGVPGAADILPITFLVIVATVTLYGFTAAPLAARLGVRRAARSRPLLVGGDPWVVDLALALRAVGVEAMLWAGPEPQRQRISAAGLELAPGELLAAAGGEVAELEGINLVLLLTRQDDFNALAAAMLSDAAEGPVYRLGPPAGSQDVVAPQTGGRLLFPVGLTRDEIDRRCRAGAAILTRRADGEPPAGFELLFRIRADGALAPVTRTAAPGRRAGDVEVLLGPASAGTETG